MIAGGHQVASHTWSHADLATLDAEGIKSEMGQLETAHLSLIGKAPTYMRPPYLSLGGVAAETLAELGYKIVEVDIDTQDWAEGPAGTIENSIEWYKGNLTAGGSLSLNHDPYQATADTFVPAIITYLATLGLKSVPAGECLGDPEANWYRGGSPVSSVSASGSASASPLPSGYGSNGTYPATTTGVHSKYPIPTGKPSKEPCGGGDTQPGHGEDSGRGALPGHKGEGNHNWNGYPVNSTAGTGSSSSSYSYPPSNASTPSSQPTWYTNGASSLTSSAVAIVVGAAALALLL